MNTLNGVDSKLGTNDSQIYDSKKTLSWILNSGLKCTRSALCNDKKKKKGATGSKHDLQSLRFSRCAETTLTS